MVEAPRASGNGSPRYLIQVRGRGFAGYTKTTGRTWRVMPVVVVVIVVMPVADAQSRFHRDGGRWRVLAFAFDMVTKRTRCRRGLSSAAAHHWRKFFVARETVSAIGRPTRQQRRLEARRRLRRESAVAAGYGPPFGTTSCLYEGPWHIHVPLGPYPAATTAFGHVGVCAVRFKWRANRTIVPSGVCFCRSSLQGRPEDVGRRSFIPSMVSGAGALNAAAFRRPRVAPEGSSYRRAGPCRKGGLDGPRAAGANPNVPEGRRRMGAWTKWHMDVPRPLVKTGCRPEGWAMPPCDGGLLPEPTPSKLCLCLCCAATATATAVPAIATFLSGTRWLQMAAWSTRTERQWSRAQ